MLFLINQGTLNTGMCGLPPTSSIAIEYHHLLFAAKYLEAVRIWSVY